METGGPAVFESETLNQHRRAKERLVIGLRRMEGWNLAHFEDEYNAHFREWFPDMKIAIGVRTGSKSLLMLNVYPSEEAANASLVARQKSLSLLVTAKYLVKPY